MTNAFMRDVESGKNPLRMASEEDFDRVINLVFASPPPVPTPFRKYLVQRAVANLPKTEEMIDALRPFLVAGNEGQLDKIKAPTLILYGSADRVTDPSMLEVYRAGIRGSEAVLIPGAGHVVFNDAPRETYRAVMGFLNR
ncbi:MAG: alpha/beta hydrolase [Planctomycetota bacterium]|nr:alpha/beta hydrolase [Planctomycetota bacterium]